MKTKMKTLVAAVAIAVGGLAAAGVANAAIDNASTGNGELFLTIWDPTVGNEASINIGLNITMNSFNGAGSYHVDNIFSTDPVFTQYFGTGSAGGSNLGNTAAWKWNVTAADGSGDAERILSTSTTTPVTTQNAQTSLYAANTVIYQNSLGAACDTCGTDVKLSPKYAGDNWGSDFNTYAGAINNAGSIGSSLYFFKAASNVASSGYENDGLHVADMTQYAYTWNLDSNGNLTYNYASAPVPLPAAVWLLGSALVGMVGVARRREKLADKSGADAALAV